MVSSGKIYFPFSIKVGYSNKAATFSGIVRHHVEPETRSAHLPPKSQGLLVQALLLRVSNVGTDDAVKWQVPSLTIGELDTVRFGFDGEFASDGVLNLEECRVDVGCAELRHGRLRAKAELRGRTGESKGANASDHVIDRKAFMGDGNGARRRPDFKSATDATALEGEIVLGGSVCCNITAVLGRFTDGLPRLEQSAR